jgi:hypothetical protein
MSPHRAARRVAVTSPQTRVARAGRRGGTAAAHPHLAPADAERARHIHRRQLRQAVTAVVLLGALLFGLPLAIAMVPELDQVRLAGVPVSWIAVAVLPYPVLVLLAGWQLRRAEHTERPGGREDGSAP